MDRLFISFSELPFQITLDLFYCICFYFLFFQAENLGCEGKVEEAQGVMKLCDLLREERKVLENVS